MVQPPLKLTMTCGPYDRAQALIDGTVQPEGIELAVTLNDDDIDRQRRAAAGEFDVAEFFMGTYIADLSLKKLTFTAIPVYIKRMFRHSYIYINKKSGIRKPTDLHGKRVGVQTWITSAALWAKGMLADDYDVDLAAIQWVAAYPVRIPDWKPPAWLKLEHAPKGSNQFELLASGAIDCALTTELWAPEVHPDIDFLFPDYASRERDYFDRTGCFPIMHVCLVRDSILEKDPWVARSLFDAWNASKQKCFERQAWERIHMTSLWYRALWEEERSKLGSDVYPWGFKKTRHELERMLRYAHEQGVTDRRHEPEELFAPGMLDT
jgi:4,5-dihydroxyphthalate decarboxylase